VILASCCHYIVHWIKIGLVQYDAASNISKKIELLKLMINIV